MQRVKIKLDNKDIYVECPNCTMWEMLGVDDPRKSLNALPILAWLHDEADTNERSIHKCTDCETTFEVEWEYLCP